jgi:hypothetical protein
VGGRQLASTNVTAFAAVSPLVGRAPAFGVLWHAIVTAVAATANQGSRCQRAAARTASSSERLRIFI